MTEERNGIVNQAGSRSHITARQFCDWLAGEMPPDREAGFLGHIGSCTFCAHQFAGWMEAPPNPPVSQAGMAPGLSVKQEGSHGYPMGQTALLEPPGYLTEESVQRTQHLGVPVGVHVRKKPRQMQLFLYSIKVGLAVTTSIFLLMLTANTQQAQPGAAHEWRAEQMQQRQEADSREGRGSITDALNQKSGEVSGFLCDISNGLFRMGTGKTE